MNHERAYLSLPWRHSPVWFRKKRTRERKEKRKEKAKPIANQYPFSTKLHPTAQIF
jgi:hypothetical protein